MFGKKKSEKKQKHGELSEEGINPEIDKKIHVMPERFYVASPKKKSGLGIIIAIGVILIVSLVAVGIYLNFNLNQTQKNPGLNVNQPINANQPSQNINENVNVNANINQNVNINIDNNSNANANLNENSNLNENVNENVNANVNQNVNSNINVNNNQIKPLPSAPDQDDDGLTAAEESIYGTNSEISDSDGDGYSDGSELLNGYDPTKPSTILASSSLFSSYVNSRFNIIYPTGWTVRQEDDEGNQVLFLSSTGEFIEVMILPNVKNLSISNWYQEQFPDIDIKETTNVSLNGFNGLRHPDNQSYYLVRNGDTSQIYLLTYNTGNFTSTNFMTTFQVMAKNFQIIP